MVKMTHLRYCIGEMQELSNGILMHENFEIDQDMVAYLFRQANT